MNLVPLEASGWRWRLQVKLSVRAGRRRRPPPPHPWRRSGARADLDFGVEIGGGGKGGSACARPVRFGSARSSAWADSGHRERTQRRGGIHVESSRLAVLSRRERPKQWVDADARACTTRFGPSPLGHLAAEARRPASRLTGSFGQSSGRREQQALSPRPIYMNGTYTRAGEHARSSLLLVLERIVFTVAEAEVQARGGRERAGGKVTIWVLLQHGGVTLKQCSTPYIWSAHSIATISNRGNLLRTHQNLKQQRYSKSVNLNRVDARRARTDGRVCARRRANSAVWRVNPVHAGNGGARGRAPVHHARPHAAPVIHQVHGDGARAPLGRHRERKGALLAVRGRRDGRVRVVPGAQAAFKCLGRRPGAPDAVQAERPLPGGFHV